jgi:hypothetical protein
MLGKRGEPEKVATTTIETDVVICETAKGKVSIKPLKQKDHPFFAGFPKTKRQKTVAEEEKFELQSINLDGYMAGQENAEIIQEQSSLMEQPSAGNLNPKVLVEKELEEARAVFEKHGIIVSEGAAQGRKVVTTQ